MQSQIDSTRVKERRYICTGDLGLHRENGTQRRVSCKRWHLFFALELSAKRSVIRIEVGMAQCETLAAMTSTSSAWGRAPKTGVWIWREMCRRGTWVRLRLTLSAKTPKFWHSIAGDFDPRPAVEHAVKAVEDLWNTIFG